MCAALPVALAVEYPLPWRGRGAHAWVEHAVASTHCDHRSYSYHGYFGIHLRHGRLDRPGGAAPCKNGGRTELQSSSADRGAHGCLLPPAGGRRGTHRGRAGDSGGNSYCADRRAVLSLPAHAGAGPRMNLTVQSLTGGYGSRTVLNNVSFSLQPGEVVCLLGANGCGKTTLFKMVLRLLRASAGGVQLG